MERKWAGVNGWDNYYRYSFSEELERKNQYHKQYLESGKGDSELRTGLNKKKSSANRKQKSYHEDGKGCNPKGCGCLTVLLIVLVVIVLFIG